MPAKRSIGRIHTERARPICCSAAPASARTAQQHRMPSNYRRHVTRNHAFVPAHMRSLAGPSGSAVLPPNNHPHAMMFRYGLRRGEARHTKWTDFDLTPGSGPKIFKCEVAEGLAGQRSHARP